MNKFFATGGLILAGMCWGSGWVHAAPASPSTWIYEVIMFSEVQSDILEGEQSEAFMEWLKNHRPERYATLEEVEAEKEAADSARKRLRSMVSNVASRETAVRSALDYYLNQRGAQGWELIVYQGNTLIFKRPG